jgi:hypothetical protein
MSKLKIIESGKFENPYNCPQDIFNASPGSMSRGTRRMPPWVSGVRRQEMATPGFAPVIHGTEITGMKPGVTELENQTRNWRIDR